MPVTSPDDLPADLQSYIEDRWPGARVEPPASGAATPCPAVPAAAAGVATGDFNGDGRADIVVRVATAAGVHLVHAVARTSEYVYFATPAEGDLANAPLVVRPRGAAFVAASGIADYFGTDTPVLECGPATTAYFWTGAGIDGRPIGK
jgi:hypothetical protein